MGQRKGLRVATGERTYVLRIDPPDVILGKRSEAMSTEITLRGINRFTDLREGEDYIVRIRSSHPGAAAVLLRDAGDKLLLRFSEAQFAVAPGQIGVLYKGDRVVAAGAITREA